VFSGVHTIDKKVVSVSLLRAPATIWYCHNILSIHTLSDILDICDSRTFRILSCDDLETLGTLSEEATDFPESFLAIK
jgi:hypothetical protein